MMDDRNEARILGKYLTGRVPSAELAERYAAARAALGAAADGGSGAVAEFAFRHPWSLGPLDAASGLIAPRGELRRRLLIAAAVFEASPEFADEFLPRDMSGPRLIFQLSLCGLCAACKFLLGALIYPIAMRGADR